VSRRWTVAIGIFWLLFFGAIYEKEILYFTLHRSCPLGKMTKEELSVRATYSLLPVLDGVLAIWTTQNKIDRDDDRTTTTTSKIGRTEKVRGLNFHSTMALIMVDYVHIVLPPPPALPAFNANALCFRSCDIRFLS
jgi:hypothetical protein